MRPQIVNTYVGGAKREIHPLKVSCLYMLLGGGGNVFVCFGKSLVGRVLHQALGLSSLNINIL